MKSKSWYKSRTIWAGIITVLIVSYNSTALALSAQCGVEGSFCVTLPAIPEFIYGILGALGIYSRTIATTEIK
jgi:hypothetical protein